MTEFTLPKPKKNRYTAVHILQTEEWGKLKSSFGWKAKRVQVGTLWVQILFRKLPLGFTIAYLPKPARRLFGKNAKLGAEVDRVCKENKAIFLKVEPDEWEAEDQLDYKLDGWRIGDPIQPPRTIVIDLRGTEEEILARMKQKTRYNIRLAGRKGVTVRAWDDVDAFYEMMQTTGGRDGFGVHTKEYYQRAYKLFVMSGANGAAELLVAEYEGKPLAAVMVFISGNRSWYMYGGSNNEERNKMPTYLIQWEAMRWAKERGAALYDLYGVPDKDEEHLEKHFTGTQRNEGLWGVYRFKRGFGGEVKRAAQALDRVYKPFLYALYRTVKK
ncbi:MAG: peptidoglycan bridge formation glycyltransferase FemA/FemB family protein [Anaerolineae bacterium]|jgi:lipid II:glycine glycyltransferase (peptidoglycan interpeptide bridge formation enzyme)|nr:peptidoglycan bridge formation glycyltransferase FemA/FemB family protein [Anaerolineae bacterium]MBT3713897.1 peptidoglycan bridge formation glycyltransferase FemA/FemB family protein [Anaerolineae bacterium]MBT4309154.1 peptidoglycan bridge formation glycyltransferase FemA/FemB family protein [Anaerolineae bacterium]MBT4458110.1 peptidoglycan bridge formation glycyltransferase FemA/FemB family protein [Anaerolineae bacterium]MBT4842551.1 peptidoglycan bridge formation glycyltransferase Fem